MNTDQLIAQSRSRFDHETTKRVLTEKYQAKMVFTHAGGMWRAGPELLTLLKVCLTDDVVIEDLYGNPVRVNAQELQTLAFERWQEQMNAWLAEYEQSRTNR